MGLAWSVLLLVGARWAQDPAPVGPKDTLGDPLPAGALARMGTARLLHGGAVTAVAYSPDGRLLASGGCEGALRLWEAVSGKPLRVFPIGATIYRPTISLAFAPDSLAIAARAGDELCLWSTTTGKRLGTWKAPGEGDAALAFAPDGKELGWITSGGPLHRLDLASGNEIVAAPAPGGDGEGGFPFLAYAPDGKTMALGEGKSVRIVERQSGKELRRCQGHSARITSAAFSPDGVLLATGSHDGTLRLWEAASAEELLAMPGYHSGRIQVSFSPDGKTLASAQSPELSAGVLFKPEGIGKDRELHLWNVASGKKTATLKQRDPGGAAFSFSPDGRRLAALGRHSVHLWDLGGLREIPPGPGHRTMVSAVAFSPDGKRVATAADDDSALRIWEAAGGTQVSDLEGSAPYQGWSRLVFFPDGKTLARSNAPVQMWDLETESELHWHSARDRKDLLNGQTFRFSPDGKVLVSTLPGGTILMRAVDSGRRILTLKGDSLKVTAVALCDDGKTLAAGYEDESVRLWDTATAKVRWTNRTGSAPEIGRATRESWARVEFLPGAKAVVGWHGGAMDVWETSTGKRLLELEGDWSGASAFLLSPDGKSIAGWRKGGLHVWETATGSEYFVDQGQDAVWRWFGQDGSGTGEGLFSFSPDGGRLVSAASGVALVWDLVTGGLPPRSLSPTELAERWEELGRQDARTARGALQALVLAGSTSVEFLRIRLAPPAPMGAEVRKNLILELSSDDARRRERASRELEARGSEADLEALQAGSLSPEAWARTREILSAWKRPLALSGNGLRTSRAVQVLEGIGSAEARELLSSLARGSRLERERQDAALALARLSAWKSEKPASR